MKIISKHKDYYDYLQGIYGIDEIMVYDRRTDQLVRHRDVVSITDGLYEHQFAICNKLWTLYEYKGKIYHTADEIVRLDEILKKDEKERDRFLHYGRWSSWGKTPDAAAIRHFNEHNGDTEINRDIRQPVLMRIRGGEYTHSKVKVNRPGYYGSAFFDSDKKESSSWSIPLLSEFGLPGYYPADKLYQEVSAFIAWTKDNPEIPNKQTDKEKLKSHGFDDKVSFRHRKNK